MDWIPSNVYPIDKASYFRFGVVALNFGRLIGIAQEVSTCVCFVLFINLILMYSIYPIHLHYLQIRSTGVSPVVAVSIFVHFIVFLLSVDVIGCPSSRIYLIVSLAMNVQPPWLRWAAHGQLSPSFSDKFTITEKPWHLYTGNKIRWAHRRCCHVFVRKDHRFNDVYKSEKPFSCNEFLIDSIKWNALFCLVDETIRK